MFDALSAAGLILLGAGLALIPAIFLYVLQSTRVSLVEALAQRNIYKTIADRAVERLELEVNVKLAAVGQPPIIPIAAVVGEHGSPMNETQRETATMATLRARLVAAELAAGGEPPRTEDDL